MTESHIRYDVDGPIAMITLNRPDKLNAIVPGMGEEYAAALLRADADPAVRAIVVTGAGRGFCAGADLGVLSESREALDRYIDGQDVDTLPTIALRLRTPVATAINGPCAGIGFVLAISADARFAHPDATMSTTFSQLGLVAEYGVAWLLTRLVGLATATDLLLTGRTITGAEAQTLGLVTGVTDDPVDAAFSWACEVADLCSPASIAVMKAQLLDVDRQSLDEAVRTSLEQMRLSFGRPDVGEALAARAAKRPAEFPPLS